MAQHFWNNVIQSNCVCVCISKAVIAVSLALVLCVGSRSLVEALDAGLLTRVDVLRVYVDAVGVRVNQTNRYIVDDAAYLNDVARAVYGDQMRAELLNLQALVDFFNAGTYELYSTTPFHVNLFNYIQPALT